MAVSDILAGISEFTEILATGILILLIAILITGLTIVLMDIWTVITGLLIHRLYILLRWWLCSLILLFIFNNRHRRLPLCRLLRLLPITGIIAKIQPAIIRK